MLPQMHLDKLSKSTFIFTVKKLTGIFFLMASFCFAQTQFSVDLDEVDSEDLFTYQANTKTWRVLYVRNTNDVNVLSYIPFMSWSYSGYASSRVTSSWSFVTGYSNAVDFTFSGSALNTNGGPFLYEVGYTDTNGYVQVSQQGDLTIYPSPFSSGVGVIDFGTNLNWGLYDWIGLPNWILTGEVLLGTNYAFTVTTNHAIITLNSNSFSDARALTNGIAQGQTGNLSITNNGRQFYATLSGVATGTPSYVDLGATNVVGDSRLTLTYSSSTRTITGSVSFAGISTGTPIYVETGISNTVTQGQTSNLSSTNSGRQNFLTITGLVQSNGTNSVTTEMITDGTIQNGDISSSAAITATKISNTGLTQATTFTGDVAGVWSALTLQNSTVTSAKIADGAITNDDINANAAIAATKIAGTAATTSQLASALASAILSDSNYPNALLRDGSRSLSGNQNAAGNSYTNATRFAGTNGALNVSTRASDSTTVWTDFNSDLWDGYDSVLLRSNAVVQGQTGYVSSSNANRQIYLTVTGLAAQADLTIATNALATNVLLKLNNLSDLASAAAARTNLNLKSASTNDSTNLVFNASQISDFAVATNDPTSGQILVLSSSVWTPKTVNGDATLSSAGALTITGKLAVAVIDTNSLSTVFATDVELSTASNALRTTCGVLATSVWANAQYPNAVLRDGSRVMLGDLDLDENDINNAVSISRSGIGFNFETQASLTNATWTDLNADTVDGIHGTNVLLNTTPQTAQGPLTILNRLSVLTNVMVASSNSLGSELISNGTFSGTNSATGLSNWSLTSASWDSGQKVYIAPGATATITYTSSLSVVAYKTYLVSFLNDIDTGTNPTLFSISVGGYTQSLSTISDGTYKFSPTLENASQQLTFSITPGTNTIFLDTVSLKEETQGDAQFADDVTIGGSLRVRDFSYFSGNLSAATIESGALTASTVTATTFIGTFSGVSTSFVAISGSTMGGPLTNNSGYYGNAVGLTNGPWLLLSGGTVTGALRVETNITIGVGDTSGGSSRELRFAMNNVGIGYKATNRLYTIADSDAELSTLYFGNTTNATLTSGGIVWHSRNDGAGSGLDADLLDGLSSAAFQTNILLLSNSTVIGNARILNFVNASSVTISGGTGNVTTAGSGGSSGAFTNHQPVLEWYAVRDNTANNNMIVSSVPATNYLSTYTATSIEECIMFWQTAATTSQDRQRAFSFSMPVAFGTSTTNIQIKMRHNQSTNGIFVIQFFFNNQSIAFTNQVTAANSTETKNIATAGTLLTNLPEGLKLYGNIIGTSQSTNTANQAQLGLMDFRIMR